METSQLSPGQRVQTQNNSRGVFKLLAIDNQTGTRTTCQERNPAMNTENFQRLLCIREEIR